MADNQDRLDGKPDNTPGDGVPGGLAGATPERGQPAPAVPEAPAKSQLPEPPLPESPGPVASVPTTAELLAALPAEPPIGAGAPTDADAVQKPGREASVATPAAKIESNGAESAKLAAAKQAAANAAAAKVAAARAAAKQAAAAKDAAANAAKRAKESRPSRRARHPVVAIGSALMTLVLVAGLAVLVGISYGETVLRKPGPLVADKIVNLSRTPGFRDIGDVLEREGVVENGWMFVGGVLLRQARQELKAGEYLFPRGASVDDVISLIVSGKAVLHQVTIPEGLTSEQTVARLLENEVLTGPIREIPKDGTLLPESYRFNRGITREQILQRMAADQRRVVADIWARRAPDLPLHSPEELVILASIVEKETGKAAERSRVAAVFVNRLQRRMKLQSDPTIIYGLVGGKGTLGRPIMRADIDRPTAYNTYVIDGLPPGPIANPGRAALEATANPMQTKELYFVADGTGGHVFAETLEEHNRNVAHWREIERQQNGQAAPASAPPAAATPPAPAPAKPAPDPGPAAAPAAQRAIGSLGLPCPLPPSWLRSGGPADPDPSFPAGGSIPCPSPA